MKTLVLLVYTLFPIINRQVGGSFQSGQSSSIGVLPSQDLPGEEAINLPLEGSTEARADCGWIIAAAGSTAPGFYTLPVFGSFNLGTANIGQSNVGFNNIGVGNYGSYNIGRLNTGYWNIGYMNDGFNNTGALNTGTANIGDQNSQTFPNSDNHSCIGYNNTACDSVIGSLTESSSYSVGSNLQGNFLFGFNSDGQNLIGHDNSNSNSVGVSNTGGSTSGIIGTSNDGEAIVGSGNAGILLIGLNNAADYVIGIGNTADYKIGAFNNGSGASGLADLSIGFNQTGLTDLGVLNIGDNFIGYNNGTSTYVDTSSTPLSQPIIFSPTANNVLANIGTNYNNLAYINEQQPRTNVVTPFIRRIASSWYCNLEFPAVLSVVDLGCPGDLIAVLETGKPDIPAKPLFVTRLASPIPAGTTCMGLNDPESAMADPTYSRGIVTLEKGFHILSFDLAVVSPVASPGTGGTSLAFRLDYIRPASNQCNECNAPIPPLFGFPDDALIGNPPNFELPEDIGMPPVKEQCGNNIAAGINNPKCNSKCNKSKVKATMSSELSKTCNPWCKSKHYKILLGTRMSSKEAQSICVDGLASTSDELINLIKKCSSVADERFWIDGKAFNSDCASIDKNGEIGTEMQCDTLLPFVCNR